MFRLIECDEQRKEKFPRLEFEKTESSSLPEPMDYLPFVASGNQPSINIAPQGE